MNEIGTLATLAGVLLLSVMSPGPNFVLVTSTAMRTSRRAGLAAAAGLGLASFTWVLLTEAGFSLLMAPGSLAAEVVRVVGAVYLVWIGLKMVLGARKPLVDGADGNVTSVWPALRKGYLVSMTSPKSIAFYVSIFAAVMPARVPLWFDGAVLLVAFLVSTLWYGSLALAFSSGRVRAGFARVKATAETVMACASSDLGADCWLPADRLPA